MYVQRVMRPNDLKRIKCPGVFKEELTRMQELDSLPGLSFVLTWDGDPVVVIGLVEVASTEYGWMVPSDELASGKHVKQTIRRIRSWLRERGSRVIIGIAQEDAAKRIRFAQSLGFGVVGIDDDFLGMGTYLVMSYE